MSKPIIKIESLYKSFGNNNILNNISFKIFENESYVILGKSGTGKSVLFKCIVGILKPDSGKIFIKDIEVSNIKEKKSSLVNKDISMVFQNSALFDSYNILDNITFSIFTHTKINKKERIKIANEVLEKVGLDSSILYLYPTELSGGMQKRVAIARSIATKPKIILFDEPTSGLDPVSSDLINKLIINVTKYVGAIPLTITHDIKSAKAIASKVLLLNNGTIAWQGSINEIDKPNNKLVYNFINGISI